MKLIFLFLFFLVGWNVWGQFCGIIVDENGYFVKDVVVICDCFFVCMDSIGGFFIFCSNVEMWIEKVGFYIEILYILDMFIFCIFFIFYVDRLFDEVEIV